MEAREATEPINNNINVYISGDKSGFDDTLDDYWDDEEIDYDDTLDDYGDDEEIDYDDTLYDYNDDGGTDTATTTEIAYQPRSTEYEIPVSVKTQQMFWSLAGLLLLVILGTRCIEKGDIRSKILATVGLVAGVVSTIMQMLMIWQVFSITESVGLFSTKITVMGKVALSIMITAVATMACAIIMRINEREKIVKAMKWIAVGTGLGFWVIGLIAIIQNDYDVAGKLISAGLALLSCCLVCWIVAWMLSRFDSKEVKADVKVKKEDVQKDSVDVLQAESTKVELAQGEPKLDDAPQSESVQIKVEQVDSARIEPVETELTQVETTGQQVLPQREADEVSRDSFSND